jgi:DNA-binding response OmpR family regulator
METHLHTESGRAARTLSARGREAGRQLPPPRARGIAARRLAVLDSDSGFLVVLGKRLELAGWRHTVIAKRISLKKAAALDVDAVVVDAQLLGPGRMNWLKGLCTQRPDISVIVCTGASTVVERVSALRNGIDDWVTKPAHPEELIARLDAATTHRRSSASREAERFSIGEVEIRPEQFQAFVGDRSLRLTRREYQLLELLCDAGDEVLPRERIYERLWGYEMVRNDRSVDVFVHKLRRKIEVHSPEWAYIHTHFGIGYRLQATRLEAHSIGRAAEEPERLAA